MSDIIQLLPDHIANQIAAGEVIQRPASVVKELLENALDAGSSKIQLIIKDAGKALVQVVDNGKGMSVTDARMCFERHATSKIKAIKDGKQIEFAKRTNVQIEKNHIGGVQSRGRIVMTNHGFIDDDKKAIDQYKNSHKDTWLRLLGSVDFDLVEEGDMEEDLGDIGLLNDD